MALERVGPRAGLHEESFIKERISQAIDGAVQGYSMVDNPNSSIDEGDI